MKAVNEYLRKYVFLEYAVQHWIGHFRDSRDQGMELFEFARLVCEAGSVRAGARLARNRTTPLERPARDQSSTSAGSYRPAHRARKLLQAPADTRETQQRVTARQHVHESD